MLREEGLTTREQMRGRGEGDDGNTREERGLRLEMTQWMSHSFSE
jgi:hypothetical protein